MKEKFFRVVKSKFGWSLIVQTIVKLLATALGLYTTSWLIAETTTAEYAEYSVIFSYVTIIQGIIVFGLPKLIQKFYTNNEDDRLVANFWTTFVFLRGASFFVGLVLIFLTFYFSTSTNLALIIALFTVQFLILADESFRAICDAKGRTWQYSLTDFAERFVFVSALVFFSLTTIGESINPLAYFIIVAIITRTLMILSDAYLQRQFIAWGNLDFGIVLKNTNAIKYLAISGIMVAMFNQTKQIILSWFGASDIELGTFFNANRLFTVAMIVPGMTIPMISSLAKQNILKSKFSPVGKWLKRTTGANNSLSIIFEFALVIMLFSVLITIGIIVFAPLGLFLIDPQGRYPLELGIDYLSILAFSMIGYPISLFFSHLLIFGHKEKYEFLSTFLVAVWGLSLYFIFIPNFIGYGAAWATVAIHIFDMFVKLALLLRMNFKEVRK